MGGTVDRSPYRGTDSSTYSDNPYKWTGKTDRIEHSESPHDIEYWYLGGEKRRMEGGGKR